MFGFQASALAPFSLETSQDIALACVRLCGRDFRACDFPGPGSLGKRELQIRQRKLARTCDIDQCAERLGHGYAVDVLDIEGR
jgi:hypothetical protein